jgi:hypothetical protein
VIVLQDENSHNVDSKDRDSDNADNDGHVDMKAGQTAAGTKDKDNDSLNDDNEIEATERNDNHDWGMGWDIAVDAEDIERGRNSPAPHGISPSDPELRHSSPGDSLQQTVFFVYMMSPCANDIIILACAISMQFHYSRSHHTDSSTKSGFVPPSVDVLLFISEQFTGQKRRNPESNMAGMLLLLSIYSFSNHPQYALRKKFVMVTS